MIRNIYVGPGLQIVGGGSAPYIYSNSPNSGQLRFNTGTQQLEVNDGCSWIGLSSTEPSISFDNETQELLAWARKKKAEDEKVETLAKIHPGIRDLKEQLDMLTILVSKETV